MRLQLYHEESTQYVVLKMQKEHCIFGVKKMFEKSEKSTGQGRGFRVY